MLRISSLLSRVVQPMTNFSHRNGMGGCQQVAFFSKYTSRSRTKRMPLNTKRVGKGYYKGTGSRKEGKITSKGLFILDREMCTELIVPDLKNFPLKPYVGSGCKKHVI